MLEGERGVAVSLWKPKAGLIEELASIRHLLCPSTRGGVSHFQSWS